MTELDFGLLGRRIRGRVSPAAASVVDELFRHPALEDALSSDWVIGLEQRREAAPPEALEDAYRTEIHAGFVMVKPRGDELWVSDADHAVRAAVRGHEVKLEVFSQDLRGGGALMVAMLEALRVTGLIPLHTAVASKGGAATAFVGASGRGKTTTLVTAVTQGFTPICEDFALLEPEMRTVFGLDRGLRCLPDTFERLRSLVPTLEDVEIVRGKRFVPYERIAPRAWSASLERVWLLERDDSSQTHLEPMTPSERVMALFTASGAPLLEAGRAFTSQTFARLARDLDLRRLWLGQGEIPFGNPSV
jgi:hypothetical protein